ncbi:MAG TPA: hypothetical protein VGW11_02055 [Solirubrobacteraceae bacterium]|nr:hypothetical protein [Solirubrobacteraceae bacterium]
MRPGLQGPVGAHVEENVAADEHPVEDPTRNRESMRHLADLEPAIVGFGHGPVLTDAALQLRAFVDGL